jgi:hypothetical protein
VSDNNVWQPPSGTPAPPPPPPAAPGAFPPPAAQHVPPTAQYLPPGQPGFGQQPAHTQQPAWTPPPKPGLIPLRPLGFGTLLGASFQVIRRNPRPTFGIALLLNGVVIVLFVGIIAGVATWAFSRVNAATVDNSDEITAGAIGAGVLAALIPIVLSVLVGAVLQGIISLEVSRATLGEKLTTRSLWRLARGRIGALIGWSAAVTGAVTVAIVTISLIITLIISFGGEAGVVIGVILAIFAGLGAVAVWFWLATKLSLIPSILMLERLSLRQAISRSWRLTSGIGYFWKILGTQLLVNFIVQTAAQVVTFPLSIVSGIGGALVNPNQDASAGIAVLVVTYVLTGIVSLVFSALASVTQASVTALLYIDVRMRKEGLDLELVRFVEARQVGQSGVGNPYLVDAPAGSQPAPSQPSPPTPMPPTNDSPWS